jgi:hypothetical protein
MTLGTLRGPLYQGASTVEILTRKISHSTILNIARELPELYFSKNTTLWTPEVALLPDVLSHIQSALARAPIKLNHTNCDGICYTKVNVCRRSNNSVFI